MKKILIVLFSLWSVCGFCQHVIRPSLDWGVSVSDITATDSIKAVTGTFSDAIRGSGITIFSMPDDVTADSIVHYENGVLKRILFSTLIDTTNIVFWYDTIPGGKVISRYGAGLLLALRAPLASPTFTGSVVVSNVSSLTNSGTTYLDSTVYFGDDGSTKDWKVLIQQQVGNPHGRAVFKNLADVYLQDKAGTGDVQIIQRDTTSSEVVANLLNIGTVSTTVTVLTPKIQCSGTDTTGHGSTANLGTIMFYNGNFYGLIAGDPPSWAKLNP
ncbi:MAG: hypothetical protein M0P47_09180 [Bacteroidales bacterium]|nr:hypothetical protein [Bacteroidales bacterium]